MTKSIDEIGYFLQLNHNTSCMTFFCRTQTVICEWISLWRQIVLIQFPKTRKRFVQNQILTINVSTVLFSPKQQLIAGKCFS